MIHFVMKRTFKSAISVTILVCGLYILLINLYQATRTEIYDENTEIFEIPSYFRGKELPFHQIYESRQVELTLDLKEPKIYPNERKVILLWTRWNGVVKTINYYNLQQGNKSFIKHNCPNPNCVVTRNRKHLQKADAVIFHLLDIKHSDLPLYRTSKQLWILYNMEPPWLLNKHMHSEVLHLRNVFNWTMSYGSNSDVIARYGFIMPSGKNLYSIPFQNKTKNVVWFVSDCVTDSKREDYVNELNKYIDVDIYGKCGKYKCYPSQSSICYKEVLDKYKFYLSFENAICKNYVTEKFFNIFNYDIIPVVFGGANYSSMAPEDTYIDATKYSEPKELATILLKISHDEGMYQNILVRKRLFKSYLDPWMCRLCDALHTKVNSSILDVKKWWLNEAQCKTWNMTEQKFINTKYELM